jgi:hypothetical protein
MNLPTDRGDAPAESAPSELDAAYARASLADGSRPSLSARASILANAHRDAAARATQIADAADPAAERRAQRIGPAAAANDSLWNWRAAAGFAGVAFAGVMALWLYRGNPEPVVQPMVLAAPEPSPALRTAASPVVPAVPAATPRAAEKSSPPAAGAPAQAPPAEMRLERAADAQARSMAAPAAVADMAVNQAAGGAATAALPAPSATALLQRWFRQALDSDVDGQQYWFVLNRDGGVLRSGQRVWTDLPALQRWLESDSAELRITSMESAHLLNRRGRDVELAYAWVAQD